jgi:hypothetical protein
MPEPPTSSDPKPGETLTPTNGEKGTSKPLTNGENQVSLTDLRVEERTLDNKISLREKGLNEKSDDKFEAFEKNFIARLDRLQKRLDSLVLLTFLLNVGFIVLAVNELFFL